MLQRKGAKLRYLDLVPNHLGVQHPWITDPPAPDWFHGTVQQHRAAKHDFYELVNPHAPRQAWSAITTGWFTDAMPDLNQENPLVSRYLIQNALWWVEAADLDGIRLDTFPYVDRAFWDDFHATLHSIYPRLTTVGEIFHRDPEVTSFFAGGAEQRGVDRGLDTPFDFPVYFALRDVLTQGKPMTELAHVLRRDALYPHPERLVPFIGNHDTTRFLTQASGYVPRLKLAMGLLMTLRGMPQIYFGDEIGIEGGDDPDNRHDFSGGFAGMHTMHSPRPVAPRKNRISLRGLQACLSCVQRIPNYKPESSRTSLLLARSRKRAFADHRQQGSAQQPYRSAGSRVGAGRLC